MDTPDTYCDAIAMMKAPQLSLHKVYHDTQYGFPIHDDNELFCRLVLEINQAGLSWSTILNKQENFRKAYNNFDIKKVSKYGSKEFERLMGDAGIIRNRLKINAAVENAKTILLLQKEWGSFKNWLDDHSLLTMEEWTKLFRKTFRFTGGEIVKEYLVSTGYLPGAHSTNCPIYKKILKARPVWYKRR